MDAVHFVMMLEDSWESLGIFRGMRLAADTATSDFRSLGWLSSWHTSGHHIIVARLSNFADVPIPNWI